MCVDNNNNFDKRLDTLPHYITLYIPAIFQTTNTITAAKFDKEHCVQIVAPLYTVIRTWANWDQLLGQLCGWNYGR